LTPRELENGAIDVWRAPLDVSVDIISRFSALLSRDEKQRAGRFRFAAHRRRFIASHGFLREILGCYLGVFPGEIVFSVNAWGKPGLMDKSSGLEFNLSHTGELAMIAITGEREIGIDVESTKRPCEIQKIAGRFFTPNEADAIKKLPPERQRKAFFACWTRKEAFLKAKGCGMSIPLDQFEVSVIPENAPVLLKTAWDPDERFKWTLFDIDNMDDYTAAVAVGGKVFAIRYFNADAELNKGGRVWPM
jgi:4'-phosphopantetheinyl transferase